MKLIASLILSALLVCLPVSAAAQGNQFKVRYNGGTLTTKTKPDEWGNSITVTADTIELKLKDGQTLVIDPKKVNALSYGQEASRRVKTYVGLAFISPLFLFGLFKKNRKHFVGIEYVGEDGKSAALLLQAKNDHYRALLTALKGVTGKEVEIEEKEKKK